MSIEHPLAAALNKLSLVLRHHAWQGGTQSDLTPTQGQILLVLARRSGADAGVSLKDVAAELAVRPSTASEAVSTLVDKGLVEKRSDPADRRRLGLVLTAAGAEAAMAARTWPDVVAQAAEALSGEERRRLSRTLQRLIGELVRQGEIPVARMCSTCKYFRPLAHSDGPPHHCAFVDQPFGDEALRFDCADHEEADESSRVKALAALA